MNKEQTECQDYERRTYKQKPVSMKFQLVAAFAAIVGFVAVFVGIPLAVGLETITFKVSEAFAIMGQLMCIGGGVVAMVVALLVFLPDGRAK